MAKNYKSTIPDILKNRDVNVLVFSSQYNGMFYDEKTAGIEMIHHGVRTATGGAVRLQNTPEQWDLIPKLINRKIDKTNNSIEGDHVLRRNLISIRRLSLLQKIMALK